MQEELQDTQKRRTPAPKENSRKRNSRAPRELQDTQRNSRTARNYALSSYLELVDWTGRIVRQGKRGRILADIPPILERLKIDPDEWLKTMRWSNRFRRAVGKLAALKAYAEKVGRQWVHGIGSSRSLYPQ